MGMEDGMCERGQPEGSARKMSLIDMQEGCLTRKEEEWARGKYRKGMKEGCRRGMC